MNIGDFKHLIETHNLPDDMEIVVIVSDGRKNDYSIADCLDKEKKEIYYKLIKGEEVNIPSVL